MDNPLVEHLKEGAEAPGGSVWARLRRLTSRDHWKRTHLHIRQRPVMRICLGLLVAFGCGIGLGVGVAAMITPEPIHLAAGAAGKDGSTSTGQATDGPVIAVSVREEAPEPKPRTLVDIDPITDQGIDPADRKTAPPGATVERTEPQPPSPVIGDASGPEQEPSSVSAPATIAKAAPDPGGAAKDAAAAAPISASDDVQGPPPAVAETTNGPAAFRPQQSETPPTEREAEPSAQPVAQAETPAEPAPVAATAETETTSDVSFEGARSVEEAARDTVPRAQVALGPAFLRPESEPAVSVQPEQTAPEQPTPELAQPDRPAPSTVPEQPGADSVDLKNVTLPPHPPTKNLRLAALPMPRGAAWVRNAVAVPDKPRDAMIAVIVDDMGIDQKRTRAIIGLPGPLTLAYIPYGYHLDELVAASRLAGHEIMLHQPMEPIDAEADPGPNALRTTVSVEENRRRLLWSFSRISGIVGLNNHMGSRFTTWPDGMRMVMEEARDRGLLFVDSFTNNQSVGYRLAREYKLPSASRDVFIDHDIGRDAIGKSLREIEKIARKRGYAVGIAHPHDLTREALETWIPDARSRGFDFVPISHIIRRGMKSG